MAVASKTWTAAYGRYVRLRITAQEVEVDVPNNRSKVRVTGQIYYDGGTRATNAYPQTYTVTVNGTQIGRQTSITYNLASGASMNLTTYTSGWIAHNSNGAKSVTVRGHITDGAGDTGTISQSYALTTIARASSFSSFGFQNRLLPSSSVVMTANITRKSSSFTHDVQLRDGSTVIQSWTGLGDRTTITLSSSSVNTLLKRMSSSTSRSLTMRVQTKSGSTNIGGALTRTATIYVHSTVVPTVENLSVSIEGNAHAKNNVKRFVQNISRVSGYFKRTANGGASIRSSTLEIRRVRKGSDHQIINSNSGTFPRAVALSGPYQARGTATDSRGRSSTTDWVNLSNFDVLAYSVPQITNFKSTRRTDTPTTVDIVRYGKHSGLSGGNVLTIRLQKRASGTTSWTNVAPDASTSSNSFGSTIPSTGHSVALSYDFRFYIVDQFGNSAEQFSTVTTQRVVLDVHKNEGVGIGKIHEEGVLDIDGNVHMGGRLNLSPESTSNVTAGVMVNMTSNYTNGHGYISHYGSDENRKAWLGIGTTGTTDYTISTIESGYGINFTSNNGVKVNSEEIAASGKTNAGSWFRFYNGLQVCYVERHLSLNTTDWQNIIMPADFIEIPATSITYGGFPITGDRNAWRNGLDNFRAYNSGTGVRFLYNGTTSATTGAVYIAMIGRWK